MTDAALKLGEWISSRGMKHSFFAAQVGIKAQTLSTLVTGRSRPSLDLAVRIEEKTGIAPREWVSK